MSDQISKKELLVQIEQLISSDNSKTFINPELLQYLEIEELLSIKENLLESKKDYSSMLDDIFEKNS